MQLIIAQRAFNTLDLINKSNSRRCYFGSIPRSIINFDIYCLVPIFFREFNRKCITVIAHCDSIVKPIVETVLHLLKTATQV